MQAVARAVDWNLLQQRILSILIAEFFFAGLVHEGVVLVVLLLQEVLRDQIPVEALETGGEVSLVLHDPLPLLSVTKGVYDVVRHFVLDPVLSACNYLI